jgi:hypothetical protein
VIEMRFSVSWLSNRTSGDSLANLEVDHRRVTVHCFGLEASIGALLNA